MSDEITPVLKTQETDDFYLQPRSHVADGWRERELPPLRLALQQDLLYLAAAHLADVVSVGFNNHSIDIFQVLFVDTIRFGVYKIFRLFVHSKCKRFKVAIRKSLLFQSRSFCDLSL